MRPTGLLRRGVSCRADRRGAESGRGPRRLVSWFLRQVVVFIPVLVPEPLPCQSLKFLSGPGTVVVLFVFQAFIFLNSEQHECLPGVWIHYPRRNGLGVLQRSYLLFRQLNHAYVLNRIVACRQVGEQRWHAGTVR